MDIIRSGLLLLSVLAAFKCGLLCWLAWRRSRVPILYWNAIHFLGWVSSASFFAWWYFLGRPDLPFDLAYWIPNIASTVMIVGAVGVAITATRGR